MENGSHVSIWYLTDQNRVNSQPIITILNIKIKEILNEIHNDRSTQYFLEIITC